MRVESGRPFVVWLIVLMLIAYGLLGPVLLRIGAGSTATITEVRRTGGAEPQWFNQYWWVVAYEFRAADGKVRVVDFGWDAPSTKQAVAALADLGIEGKVLVVLDAADVATWKSFRNLGDVHLLVPGELNAYDVLVADWIVFTPGTVPVDTPLSRGGHRAPAADAPAPADDEAAEEDR